MRLENTIILLVLFAALVILLDVQEPGASATQVQRSGIQVTSSSTQISSPVIG